MNSNNSLNRLLFSIINVIVLTVFFACGDEPRTKSEKAPVEITDTSTGAITEIEIETKEYDFGTIHQSDSAMYRYSFQNTGNQPLIIKAVQASCGCTVPTWSKEPILPGARGFVDVKFKPSEDQIGFIRKSVVINANTESLFHVFYISGNVRTSS